MPASGIARDTLFNNWQHLACLRIVQEAYERLDAREQRARKQEADLADAKQAAQVCTAVGSRRCNTLRAGICDSQCSGAACVGRGLTFQARVCALPGRQA